MRVLIRDLGQRGITVLLSSHQMWRWRSWATALRIIRKRRVAYEGSLEELRPKPRQIPVAHQDDARRGIVWFSPSTASEGGRDIEGRAGVHTASDESAVEAISAPGAE